MKTGILLPGGHVLLQPLVSKSPLLLGCAPGFGKLLPARSPPRGPAGSAHGSSGNAREPERTVRRHAAASSTTDDPLDPMARQAAQLAPPPQGRADAADVAEAPAARARTSLEDLLPALVRKVAWSGDGRRGTVRLELGSGGMAGAEVVVESDDGRVRVQLRAPGGVDADAWRQRVIMRLAARGLNVEDVQVQ